MKINAKFLMTTVILAAILVASPGAVFAAETISLEEALDFAVNSSSRGRIMRGNLEVARQYYRARRINFMFPEISINGSLPSYNESEDFRFFGGAQQKNIIRTSDLSFASDITLKQSLLTGGELTFIANLLDRESEYPLSGLQTQEDTRQGIYRLNFTQPLLKPSTVKHELNNKSDDFDIAGLTYVEELKKLKTEVIDAYIGLLQLSLRQEIAEAEFESAGLKASIDSSKFGDGVLAEEGWLESESARLDAELNKFDIDNQLLQKQQELTVFLDRDDSKQVKPTIPLLPPHLTEPQKNGLIDSWKNCNAIRVARLRYDKAERAAGFAAGSHGLSGTFDAKYVAGRGQVVVDDIRNPYNTNSWEVGINVTYPLWDGGSSGAAVYAAELEADQARIELDKARKAARAEITILINQLDVSYRKLDLLRKQIDLAKNKIGIADFRFKDGQISKLTFLESQVFFLEAQDKYLEELKDYFNTRTDLDSKYSS